jgi:hypothetical protein
MRFSNVDKEPSREKFIRSNPNRDSRVSSHRQTDICPRGGSQKLLAFFTIMDMSHAPAVVLYFL